MEHFTILATVMKELSEKYETSKTIQRLTNVLIMILFLFVLGMVLSSLTGLADLIRALQGR